MAGARSRANAADKQAVTNYNGTGNHRVSDKSVSKERRYSDTYGPIGGATGEGQSYAKRFVVILSSRPSSAALLMKYSASSYLMLKWCSPSVNEFSLAI